MSGSAARKHFIFIIRVLDCRPLGHLSHQMPFPHNVRPEITRTIKLDFGELNSGLEKARDDIFRPEISCWFCAAPNGAQYVTARARASWRWRRPKKLPGA